MAVDTLANALAQYTANVAYDSGAGSVTMAEDFVAACRALIGHVADMQRQGQTMAQFTENLRQWPIQAKAAESWLSVNGTAAAGTSPVKHLDFTDFRS